MQTTFRVVDARGTPTTDTVVEGARSPEAAAEQVLGVEMDATDRAATWPPRFTGNWKANP